MCVNTTMVGWDKGSPQKNAYLGATDRQRLFCIQCCNDGWERAMFLSKTKCRIIIILLINYELIYLIKSPL